MNKLEVVDLEDLKKVISSLLDERVGKLVSSRDEVKIEYLRTTDVLKMLKITKPTLIEWRKRGIIPSYRLGTQVRFIKSEIIDAIKGNQTNKYAVIC